MLDRGSPAAAITPRVTSSTVARNSVPPATSQTEFSARLSPDLRTATLPAAVGILSAAAARINSACAERLPLEMRVSRTVALMLHSAAERAWLWAPRATDPPHAAALKEEGRQYMRSLW